MNDIQYLSEYLLLKSNNNNSSLKKELDTNIFLDYFVNKYSPFHTREFSNIIKSYKDSENPDKTYNEIYEKYLNDLKKEDYNTSFFDIIFESFFPKPFDLTTEKMTMIDYMVKQMNKNNKNNKINKSNKNFENKEIKNMMIMNRDFINELNVKIEEYGSDINIIFILSNIQILKYKWGSKDLFYKLLDKLNLKTNSDFQSILKDVKPIEDINYNLTSYNFNITIEKIKSIFNFYLNNKTTEEKFNINEKTNKEIYLFLNKISNYNTINDNNYFNNKEITKKYIELFDIKILIYIYKYIYNNFNQFIEFDYNINIKIKKLLEKYKIELDDLTNKDSFEFFFDKLKKKKEIHYLLGKNTYKNPFSSTKHGLRILELFNLIYDIQLKFSISKHDLLISLLFHQYDYSIITNDNNNYFIRRDIENYYLTKFYIFENFSLDNMNLINYKKIKYTYPYILNTTLFLDIENESKIPFDIILKDKSLIIDEKQNSEYKSSDNYLDNVSLNKNLIIMKDKNNKKLENYYTKKDLLDKELFNIDVENQELDLNKFTKILKGGKKIKKMKMIKELINKDSYYNIFEEKYLNPIQDFKPSKYAYCSLYYGNNQYFLDAMLFGYSLYLSGTKNDRILLCTTDVLLEQRKQLSRFYNRIFIVKPLDIDPLYFKSENRWYGVFNKLYAFYLDEYEKIFLMDTDMIIQKSEKKNKYDSFNTLDTMFEKLNTPCGMCYDKEYITTTNEKIPERLIEKYLYENKTIISAGIYLIKPSKDIFIDIINKTNPNLNKDIKSKIIGSIFPEEAFLANYFKKEGIYSLSVQYSFTPMWLDISMDKLGVKRLLENIKEEDIVVVHYIGYKNWSYLISPYWFIFEKNELNNKIEKYKKLWCSIFFDLQDLCNKETYGIEAKKINSLINYCKWDKISFSN